MKKRPRYSYARMFFSNAIQYHMDMIENMNDPAFRKEFDLNMKPVKVVEFELRATDANGSEIIAQLVVDVEE